MAENIGNLAYKLTVDNAGVSQGFNQSGQTLQRFSDQTRQQTAGMEQRFTGLGQIASGVFDGFKTGGVQGAIGLASAGLGGLSSQLITLAGVGATFTAGIIAGLKLVVEQAVAANKEIANIGKTARGIGESNRNTQVLQQVLRSAGFEDAAAQQQFLLRFFDRLGDLQRNTTGPTGQALTRLGLDPEKIKDLKPEAAFEQIILALNRVDNVYQRAALSQEIFGRQFADLEPIIRRGASVFAEARDRVGAAGASDFMIQQAQATQSALRTVERLDERHGATWTQLWNHASTGLAAAWANYQVNLRQFGRDLGGALAGNTRTTSILAPVRGPNTALLALSESAARTREADAAAATLVTNWRAIADNAGRTAREVEITNRQAAGASRAKLDELIAADRLATASERRLAAEQQVASLVASTATAYERFAESIETINLAVGGNRSRAQFAAFRDLERAVGNLNPSALTGVTAGTVEAAKLIAEAQTAARNGLSNPQDRVATILEQARQLSEAQLREMEEITRILRDRPELGLANLPR